MFLLDSRSYSPTAAEPPPSQHFQRAAMPNTRADVPDAVVANLLVFELEHDTSSSGNVATLPQLGRAQQ
jgi:hypothetical protein